jgi:hypothetical protein
MTILIRPDGSVICLDGTVEGLGEEKQERASHVYRDDALRLPWQSKPVLSVMPSPDGPWRVRLSFSEINGALAGYQLPQRFPTRREAIRAEVNFIEQEVL